MDTYSPSFSSIRMEIQKIDYLPPMPAIAQEILVASNNQTSDIDDITGIIKKDPGLTAKIIGVANSAYFSYPRKITTLEEAIINVLGLDLVTGFALTIAMSGVFDPEKCPNFNLRRYWCSAFLTAELASGFGPFVDKKHGLKNEQLYLKNKEKHLIEYEKETIDFNHHEAGGWLARKWNLPEEIIDIIEHLHEPRYQGEHEYTAHLIGLCSRIARQWLLETNYCPIQELSELTTLKLESNTLEKYLDQAKHKLEDIQQLVDDMTG